MAIYLQSSPNYEGLFVWNIEDGAATRIDVPESTNARFVAKPGEDIWEHLASYEQLFPNGKADFHLATLKPGEYYPRIARPGHNQPTGQNLRSPSSRQLQKELAISKSQLGVLLLQLKRICQTVQPIGENLNVFGHEIRNLLILACTEVESHWRAVLTANGHMRERYSTNDYVKLEAPMKLGSYGLSFVEYPWLESFKPFASWGLSGAPTKELRWYDSYNQVKHDRETSFERGKLRHAFEAVAANAIMVAAQFGFYDSFRAAEFADAFAFNDFPTWPLGDVYIRPLNAGAEVWTAVHCSL